MVKNMGRKDKLIRMIVALVIASLYYFGYISGTLALVLLIIGIILALTSVIQFCPIYKLVNINTCEVKKN
ncbi:MAG: DUF2892 domain-containing protein [Saprospiraceae bacterium]|nr:DUF2892 domain-containing protein [Saprospiraceae bacterium]MBK6566691.1 DUF2892 domain-containing protein [Saprospiraceae bacterium]MBK8081818.1 DUF2892 domain-containing protein [Saprospiraceae bacterium]MBK8370652.1 DUF2892 domain-containing protein [Saprospiraceae bacterium]MBK8546431.1 DUF2892 domain-containing protein [Saprospiraceae bacterium]